MPQDARILDFTAFLSDKADTPAPVKKGRRQSARHKSGLFRLHFRYKDPFTGAACQKDVYGATRAEAERKKKAFLKQVEQGLRMTENGRTLSQWADEWLETYKRPYVKENTLEMYERHLTRIKDIMGQRPLSSILPVDIQCLMQTRNGQAASTIKKTYITINAIMTAAVNNRLIAYNPCAGVVIPDGPAGTHRALTDDEIKVVMDVATDGHKFGLIMMLMLFAGLRRSEAAALRPEDVYDGSIHILRAAYWVNNRPKVGTTKSRAGVRAVPIFPPLKPYIDAFAASPASEIITLSAFMRGYQSFIYACEEKINGCSRRWQPEGHQWETFDIRAHDLRHTFASILYDAGVDIKTAQRWLGHSDPAITLKIYTHLSKKKAETSEEEASKYISETYI